MCVKSGSSRYKHYSTNVKEGAKTSLENLQNVYRKKTSTLDFPSPVRIDSCTRTLRKHGSAQNITIILPFEAESEQHISPLEPEK